MGEIIYTTPISYGEIDLSWIVGRQVLAVSFHDPSPWVFDFGSGGVICVYTGLWRIIDHDRIVLGAGDHLQLFGLPTPVDAVAKARELLSGPVEGARLREATADLVIKFEGDRSLEIIATSLGYESWQMKTPSGREYVAQGGGQICTWRLPESAQGV